MSRKEKLEEGVQFWLSYINVWKRNHNEPIQDQVQLLLENALIKLERYYSKKEQTLLFPCNNHCTQ